MNRAAVSAELTRHARAHPEDAVVVARFAQLVEQTGTPFARDQFAPGHLTCSACVLDETYTRVLLLHHARLGRWLQPGGHTELEDELPLNAALRELREESGLAEVTPLYGEYASALIDLDVHEIPPRAAEPAHLHYDLRYAFAVKGDAALQISEESTALRWIAIERLAELTDEESVTRLVARTVARARSARGATTR